MEESYLQPQECNQLALAMNQKYGSYLDGRQFEISTEDKDGWIYLKVLLKNADESYFYPVEARVNYAREELSKREAALFLIDYIDLYFEEYLAEDENLYIPIDWKDYQYDAVDFQMRGQVLNLHLERMADQLIAKHSF